MAHGFSAVKEMYLDKYAEAFAAAGLNALVFDNRNFGASDGEPRQEIDPWAQVRDYRHAITYAGTLAEVDDDRIGVWGSSYSGGHVLVVGAIDRRVKAVVARCRWSAGTTTSARWCGPTSSPASRPCSTTTGRPASGATRRPWCRWSPRTRWRPRALPTPRLLEWFTETGKTRAPSWRNEVTLRSVEMFSEYEPIAYIALHQPDPAADGGGHGRPPHPGDLAIAAYEKAREPKKLKILPGGHFDAYVDGFDDSRARRPRLVRAAPRGAADGASCRTRSPSSPAPARATAGPSRSPWPPRAPRWSARTSAGRRARAATRATSTPPPTT